MYSLFSSYLIYNGLPSNISFNWNFGSVLGLTLVIQILTGVSLAMHYTANIDLSFYLVEHIMRDINYGWLIRYIHSNGASMFFLFVYLHIGRGLYAGSYVYPRSKLWNYGVLIYILMMGTAFLGYVLPFGQMSIWGATVITNLLSAIPYIGNDLVVFVWGGWSVGNPTLNRFFSLHYLLPFLLSALVALHLMSLHEVGSTNPLGINSNVDKIYFHPYFTTKDIYFFILYFALFAFLVFYIPNYLSHPDNYIPANPLVTPLSIVPEWYLLVPYAILRIIPSKLMGVLALAASLFILFLLPFQSTFALRSTTLKSFSKLAFWLFVGCYLTLIVAGALPVSIYVVNLAIIGSIYYFVYFLFIIPAIYFVDSLLFIYQK